MELAKNRTAPPARYPFLENNTPFHERHELFEGISSSSCGTHYFTGTEDSLVPLSEQFPPQMHKNKYRTSFFVHEELI
jgi:hypothetical protein